MCPWYAGPNVFYQLFLGKNISSVNTDAYPPPQLLKIHTYLDIKFRQLMVPSLVVGE